MTPAELISASKTRRNKFRPDGLPATRRKVWDVGLAARRKAIGLTQHEVAAGAGVSPATYSAAEKGADICLTTARRIAAFFGVSVDDIWPVAPEPHAPASEGAVPA